MNGVMTQQSANAQSRRTITTVGFIAALLVGVGLAVFSDPKAQQVGPEPPSSAAKPAPAKAATASPKPKREKRKAPEPAPAEITWDDPPEWKRLPRSGMRYASYDIPSVKGDPRGGELNVFILSGDVEANIQRWMGEFSKFDPKTVVRTNRTVNNMKQATVEIPKGHFNGGMGDTKASDNYGLLGGIIEAPSGSMFFFKLTGPSPVLKAARNPFYKMLDSARVDPNAAPPPAAAPAASPATSPGTAPAGAPGQP